MSTEPSAAEPRNDLLISLSVVACLGLGAAATWWLTRSETPAAPVAALEVQGELLNAKVPVAPSASAVASAAQSAPETSSAPAGGGDYLDVNFNTLSSFLYEIPEAEEFAAKRSKDQIPAPVKTISGKKVAVQGFMMPVKVEKGMVKNFLLIKDQSVCCFGRVPRMNEWISVKLASDKSVRFVSDQPVTVFGKIDIGEEFEKGELLSIYRLDADDVAGPLDL